MTAPKVGHSDASQLPYLRAAMTVVGALKPVAQGLKPVNCPLTSTGCAALRCAALGCFDLCAGSDRVIGLSHAAPRACGRELRGYASRPYTQR